jgi:hypothetical protein
MMMSRFNSKGNLLVLAVLVLMVPMPADAGTTERVSVDSFGVQGNYRSFAPSISADGRFVAFSSGASNLVEQDNNGKYDVFVHDRDNGVTERISVDNQGVEGNSQSIYPQISASGRFVAFHSDASNLVTNDQNGKYDVFVHDRLNGTTELVSKDSSGVHGNLSSLSASISTDGRYVAFYSEADNLVGNDGNSAGDIFVRDRISGITERVNVDSFGVEANSWSSNELSISGDGRFVAFFSNASNLVFHDTNDTGDVFVYDRWNAITERVSIDSSGVEGNSLSSAPRISEDGSIVVFHSTATNLVNGDNNQNSDVFVHDLMTGITRRVSEDIFGEGGNSNSFKPSISADGRFVGFHSVATNLVEGDANEVTDVFLHDLWNVVTERVSLNDYEEEGNHWSHGSSISADGRYVTYVSSATNLVSTDTNGHRDVFVHDRLAPFLPPPQAPTASELLFDLAGQIELINLKVGISNSLDAKLDAIDNALNDLNTNNDVAACNALNAFINSVLAQSGTQIAEGDAAALIEDAMVIVELLGC